MRAAVGANEHAAIVIIPTAAAAAAAVEAGAVVARARQQRDAVLRDDARELPEPDDVGALGDGDARGLGDLTAREAVLRPRRPLEEVARREDAA